ncbi:sugar phosphate isomerase/epimerase [Neorhizobium galegae]|uniref:sugar phosphate isomerase/epimerase family protein n=1 Tax=Neorhizobium galegae TaxID=399 RepID=UPI0012703EF2|nr:TIM barrel protein [Neorhizobium galegae]KAA9383859.1 sugar phosphate isomerase/epimerase [Neorhizobium galegae]KAB1115197.1 sugar phosphate isomerase/epimerase [Neorhizobium galegae]MCM2496851.1 sugar phosphate isomerase/epimerase [Neorhizobium galegae]MCQ1775045.1 sugar phosphate isomerase/epimerase [Neorhizobium galegae]MCQ1799719.1 sugar phosphate isomerase/epimerase [Neorhizobium galegae]
MQKPFKRDIYFSFFMFTADARPDDKAYTQVLIRHLQALTEMGYTGFDLHIASGPAAADHHAEVDSYVCLKRAFDDAGFRDAKFTTNVGTTRTFDPTSPYEEQRRQALAYLKSRVDITLALGGEDAIMSGPFLYPYGVFPLNDSGDGIWSDALQDWMKPRYAAASAPFRELAAYANEKKVKLAIEPVKNWETPGTTMISDALDFLETYDIPACGVTIDTAQVVMESQGPAIFKANVARATRKNQLNYVHISGPDRGAVTDSWIPWDIMLGEIEPVYTGPYLVEVFNAIPPFDSSMRMTRRRFWRPGEDEPETGRDSAYDVARSALKTLEDKIAAFSHSSSR